MLSAAMATQAESPATDAARPAPEAIEQKLVDESKKAGVPAFQFDPDASPEKKAEQAKMVRRLPFPPPSLPASVQTYIHAAAAPRMDSD